VAVTLVASVTSTATTAGTSFATPTLGVTPVAGDIAVAVVAKVADRDDGTTLRAFNVTGVTGLGGTWTQKWTENYEFRDGTTPRPPSGIEVWTCPATTNTAVTATLDGSIPANVTVYLVRGLTSANVRGVTGVSAGSSLASPSAATGLLANSDLMASPGQFVIDSAFALWSGAASTITQPDASVTAPATGWTYATSSVANGVVAKAYRIPSTVQQEPQRFGVTLGSSSTVVQSGLGLITVGDPVIPEGRVSEVYAEALVTEVPTAQLVEAYAEVLTPTAPDIGVVEQRISTGLGAATATYPLYTALRPGDQILVWLSTYSNPTAAVTVSGGPGAWSTAFTTATTGLTTSEQYNSVWVSTVPTAVGVSGTTITVTGFSAKNVTQRIWVLRGFNSAVNVTSTKLAATTVASTGPMTVDQGQIAFALLSSYQDTGMVFPSNAGPGWYVQPYSTQSLFGAGSAYLMPDALTDTSFTATGTLTTRSMQLTTVVVGQSSKVPVAGAVDAPVDVAGALHVGLNLSGGLLDVDVDVADSSLEVGTFLDLAGAIDVDVSVDIAVDELVEPAANGGGEILLETTSDVEITPTWLRVNVTNGAPGDSIELTLDDDPTVLLTADLDETGQAIGISVPLPELTQGDHILRTGVAEATFPVLNPPVAYPVARLADAKPVPPPEVSRWALQDPSSDGVTYVFPINPARMSSPHAARVFTTDHTTAADGQPLTFEGSPVGVDWTFEGTVQTASFYDSLEAFLAAGRRLFCFDHLDRIWEISLESIDWEPVRDSRHPWAHRYKAKAIIYGQVQP
jgi:hypothetical protein